MNSHTSNSHPIDVEIQVRGRLGLPFEVMYSLRGRDKCPCLVLGEKKRYRVRMKAPVQTGRYMYISTYLESQQLLFEN